MKNTLVPVKTCLACQMELNPFLNVNGKVVRPKEYCDDTCRSVYRSFHKYFREGRVLAEVDAIKADIHRLRTTPRLDLRL